MCICTYMFIVHPLRREIPLSCSYTRHCVHVCLLLQDEVGHKPLHHCALRSAGLILCVTPTACTHPCIHVALSAIYSVYITYMYTRTYVMYNVHTCTLAFRVYI